MPCRQQEKQSNYDPRGRAAAAGPSITCFLATPNLRAKGLWDPKLCPPWPPSPETFCHELQMLGCVGCCGYVGGFGKGRWCTRRADSASGWGVLCRDRAFNMNSGVGRFFWND